MAYQFLVCENSGSPRNKTVSYFKDTDSGKVVAVFHTSKEEPNAENIVAKSLVIKELPKKEIKLIEPLIKKPKKIREKM